MTDKDYSEWLRHHRSMFPDIKAWFGKMTPAEADNVSIMWHDALVKLDYKLCVEASTAMYNAESRPRTYADHPAWISRWVKNARQSQGRYWRTPTDPRSQEEVDAMIGVAEACLAAGKLLTAKEKLQAKLAAMQAAMPATGPQPVRNGEPVGGF